MIKVVEFFRRRPDLAPEAFLAHWRDRHTDVVLGIHGLRRYVQNPVIPLAGVEPAGFDGAVEVWFDSLDVMRANGRSDYWPVVVEDEKRFIDRDSRQFILSESTDPPPITAGPKLMLLLRKAPAQSVAEFRDRLAGQLAALANIPQVRELDCDLPIASSYDKPRNMVADAVVSVRFALWEEAEAATAEKALRELAHDGCLAVAERVIRQ